MVGEASVHPESKECEGWWLVFAQQAQAYNDGNVKPNRAQRSGTLP